MLKSQLKNELLQLGLTDNEVKFYIAGLELGLDTIPQIAERAGLSRMSGYNIYKSLNQKGLADMDVRSYGQKCKVAKPAKLLTVFEDHRKKLDRLATNLPKLIGELNVMYSSVPEDIEIHYYRGKDAITKVWDEAFTQAKKGDDILVLSAVDYAPTLGSKYAEYLQELQYRAEEKKLNIKVILEKTARFSLETRTITQMFPGSFVKQLGATIEQIVYADTVAYIFPGQELFGITVHSKEFANHQSRMFYTNWNNRD